MTIWIDAQLSPALAAWISSHFEQVEAFSVKELGLRDAEDLEIFHAARKAEAIVMTKDQDFVDLLERLGPPPQVLWITCGNTSNSNLKAIFLYSLGEALDLLRRAPLVEISN